MRVCVRARAPPHVEAGKKVERLLVIKMSIPRASGWKEGFIVVADYSCYIPCLSCGKLAFPRHTFLPGRRDEPRVTSPAVKVNRIVVAVIKDARRQIRQPP